MKNQGKGGPVMGSSSSVHVYQDYQKVAFRMYPGNGLATATASHTCVPDVVPNSHGRCCGVKEGAGWTSGWTVESSSQACSGAEGNSTDPQETLTESSTLTFVDAHSTEESGSLHGVGAVYLKEFVLIDDDDDGDMSLREKTVTDMSAMDGGAADLVCRRLFSSSSGSVSEAKVESPAPEGPGPEGRRSRPERPRCCLCSIL